MSMDPEFTARYLQESDGDADPSPGRGLDTEPDIGAEPQAPGVPSLPEPTAPPSRPQVPDWETTSVTQVVPFNTAPPPPPSHRAPANPAAQEDQRRPPSAPVAPQGGSDYREAPRHRDNAGADTDAGRRYRGGPAAASFDGAFGQASPQAARSESTSWGQPAEASPAEAQQYDAQPPRPQATTGYEIARSEAQPPSWDASGSHFSGVTSGLRAEDVVQPRKLPPEMGWRKAVYVSSGKTINLGAGPAEQRLRDHIDAIKTNIPGNYLIGVICVRGGVGKTRTTAGVGTAYATYRTEPVIAIDANPTYGSLGRVVDPTASASIREFLADASLQTYPMARHYTGKNKEGLEVLAANQNVANPLDLSPQAFGAVLNRVRRFYQLSIIDCGPEIEHPVMQAVLRSVDSLIIVGTMNFDGAAAAETTIKWLAARSEYQALLRRSALVLNDVYNCRDKDFLAKVTETIGQAVGGTTMIPWDPHLRDSAQLDFPALRRSTQLAYIELAAWLSQGFRSGRTALR